MGERVQGPQCGNRLGSDWIDRGTMCRSRSSPPGPTGRERAKTLKAADACAVLQASLPFVLKCVTAAQIQQMQRVLDAAVVNPVVEKEANDLYRRSIVAQSGRLTVYDNDMVRRAYRVGEGRIPVTEADKRIRLDFEALLTPNALTPVTDNPDEATYLRAVRQTLATKGVWLRIAAKYVHDPEDLSHFIVDTRAFEVWLSLDPDGDRIPTEDGRLTRDVLLDTTMLGAGYYERVNRGPVQTALNNEIRRLLTEIEAGEEQHNQLAKIRRDAPPGAVEVSDMLGGDRSSVPARVMGSALQSRYGEAFFPDLSIWDQPRKCVLRAMELNVGGNVLKSRTYLVGAAGFTRSCARLLADYIDHTSAGAERAVKVLKVLKTAGEVAQVALTVTWGVGLVRGAVGLARVRAGVAGARAAAKNFSPGAFAPTNKIGPVAFADTKNVANATLETGNGIAAMGAKEIASQERIAGWLKEFEKGLAEAQAARKGASVPMDVVEEIAKRADAKWGNTWQELP